MRFLFIFIYLFVHFSLFPQFGNDFLYYSSNKKSINVGSEFDLNSDFISNKFIYRFYNGGYIDKSLKDDQLKRTSGINKLGGFFNNSAIAFLGNDSSKYRFIVGINHKQFFNASLTDDMYKLAFYGNRQFVGDYANLGSTQINNYSYQELKFGFLIDGVDTSKAIMGMSVSYLKGQNFFRLNTNNSSLYTAPDASYLKLTTNAQLSLSDTASTKFSDINGNGLSTEFFIETPYKSKLGNSRFIVSIANLGFIKWNNNTLNYTTDSTFSFSGVKINDIFELTDSTLNAISLDSINENSTNLDRAKNSTNLPVSFIIFHKIRFNSLFELSNGFRYLFNANYKPYLFTEANFYIKDNTSLTAHVGFGGYGKLTGGISASILINKHFNIRIGSNSIQGIVLPNSSIGIGGFFSCAYKF
jgi:hypothetical protein